MRNQSEHLRGFLGSYFHQDWDLEFRTADEAVAAFIRDLPDEQRRIICKELDYLLNLLPAERIDDRFMIDELYCYYWPGRDGRSNVDFLRWVRGRIAKHDNTLSP